MKIGTLCSTEELIYILSIFLCWEFIVRDQTRSSRRLVVFAQSIIVTPHFKKGENVTKKEWIDIFLSWKLLNKLHVLLVWIYHKN